MLRPLEEIGSSHRIKPQETLKQSKLTSYIYNNKKFFLLVYYKGLVYVFCV